MTQETVCKHLLIGLHVNYLNVVTLPSIVLGKCDCPSEPLCPALVVVVGIRQVQLDNTHGHNSIFPVRPPLN